MDWTIRPRRAWALLLLLCVGCAAAAMPATASSKHRTVIRITGKTRPHGRASFSVRKLRRKHVVRATVVSKGRRRPVKPGRLHPAKGTIVVKLPASGPAPASQPDPASQPAPAPSAPSVPQPPPAAAPVLVVVVVPPAPAPTDPAPAPVTTPTDPPAASTPAPAGPTAELTAPGAPFLSDAEAAANVRRSGFEPRPANAVANHTVPTAAELAIFRAVQTSWGACTSYRSRITGDFTGTTDEIIQWAAWKWGLPEDVIRAEAAKETWWKQAFVGDSGLSFGIMQIKKTVHLGTYPASAESTAFNLDYYGGLLRYYYDGCATWLNDVTHVGTYAAGDLWGSIGAWYAGRWHTTEADGYAGSVRSLLDQRVWEAPGF